MLLMPCRKINKSEQIFQNPVDLSGIKTFNFADINNIFSNITLVNWKKKQFNRFNF